MDDTTGQTPLRYDPELHERLAEGMDGELHRNPAGEYFMVRRAHTWKGKPISADDVWKGLGPKTVPHPDYRTQRTVHPISEQDAVRWVAEEFLPEAFQDRLK